MSNHKVSKDYKIADIDEMYDKIADAFLKLEDYIIKLQFFIDNEKPTEPENINFEKIGLFVVPNLSMSSIILACSIFEDKINSICDDIRKRKKVSIKRREFSGGIIKSANKYLQNFGNFERPDELYWKIVENIFRIRNQIVHDFGSITLTNLLKMLEDLFNKSINEDIDNEIEEILSGKYYNEIETYNGLYKSVDNKIIRLHKFSLIIPEIFNKFFKELRKEHIKIFGGIRIIK